jgi:hypothetical protein
MQDATTDLIDQAEQVLMAAQFHGAKREENQALYSLAHAQASNGRRARAIRTAHVIKERETRCKALLLLHALSQEGSVPDFLEELL